MNIQCKNKQLINAVKYNNIDIVKILLAQGAITNYKDEVIWMMYIYIYMYFWYCDTNNM